MTQTITKVDEDRLRRAAARQGYHLKKIRRRDPRALDYGKFELTVAAAERGAVGEKVLEGDFARVEKFLEQ